jgi:hypothetical protein
MALLTLFSIGATPYRASGICLLCGEVRYAAVWYAGVDGLDRRLGSVNLWQAIEIEQTPGLPSGPLPAQSAIVALLLPTEARGVATVQYVLRRDLQVPHVGGTQLLDAELLRHAAASGHNHHKAERRSASVTLDRLRVQE